MSQDSEITSIDDAPTATAATPKTKAPKAEVIKANGSDAASSGKLKTVTIHAAEGDEGGRPVFLSINGYAYQIPRGKPVRVPDEVVEVLQNAVVSTYKVKGGGEVEELLVPRYAFSVSV